MTKPINLGNEVNSKLGEGCPIITPDGKYLFFTKDKDENGLSNIYWVGAQVIENVRPAEDIIDLIERNGVQRPNN